MTIRAAVLAIALASAVLAQSDDIRSWTVEGDVWDSKGAVEGAAMSASGPGRVAQVSSDAKGHFALTGSAPGLYTISASKRGAAPAKPRSLTLLPGSHTTSIDFMLDAPAVIEGKVVDADGNPQQGAFVGAWVKTFYRGDLRLAGMGNSTTDDRGVYRISGLGEGRYYLSTQPPIIEPRKRTPRPRKAPPEPKQTAPIRLVYYPNSPSLDGSPAIIVRAGEERRGADLTLGRGDASCIYATVAPFPGAGETVLQLYAQAGGASPTVANGTIEPGEESETCGVTPGDYTLLATSWDQRTRKANGFLRLNVAVGRRDVSLGVLRLSPGFQLHGRITVENGPGNTLHGAAVDLRRQSRPIVYGDDLLASVQEDGQFTLANVFPDDYRLGVTGLAPGCYVQGALQQGRDVWQGLLRPELGDLRIVLSCDGARIAVSAVNDRSEPVPDATVVLVPKGNAGGLVVFSSQTDQSGQAEFSSEIAPGDYLAGAFLGLYEGEDRDPEFIQANLRNGTEISVAAGSSKSAAIVARAVH